MKFKKNNSPLPWISTVQKKLRLINHICVPTTDLSSNSQCTFIVWTNFLTEFWYVGIPLFYFFQVFPTGFLCGVVFHNEYVPPRQQSAFACIQNLQGWLQWEIISLKCTTSNMGMIVQAALYSSFSLSQHHFTLVWYWSTCNCLHASVFLIGVMEILGRWFELNALLKLSVFFKCCLSSHWT